MDIEILYLDGCPHVVAADRRVREVIGELEHPASVRHTRITSEVMAVALRFPGSPTIRVNGRDVAPAPGQSSFGLHCRLYPGAEGSEGVPAKEAIRMALQGGSE